MRMLCLMLFVLSPTLVMAQTPVVIGPSIDQQIADLREDVKRLREDNEGFRKRFNENDEEMRKLQAKYMEQDSRLSQFDSRLNQHDSKLKQHDDQIHEVERQLGQLRSDMETLSGKIRRLEEINPVAAKDFAVLLTSFAEQQHKIFTMDIDHNIAIKALCARIKRVNAKADFAIARPPVVREVYVERPVPTIPVVTGYYGFVPRYAYRYPTYTSLAYYPW